MPNLIPPRLVTAWGGLNGNIRGSLLMLINALIFSIMVALIKVSSSTVPITLVMFFSVATQFLFIGLRHFRGFGQAVMGSTLRGAHLLRVFLLVSSMYAGFSAVVLLPLAEATAISFSKAFFVTLFAAILLKEAVGPKRWLAVAIGFGGILILARPGGGDLSVTGAALGVISAATAAAGAISTRFLAQRDPASLLLLYQTAFGTLMLAPVAIWNWVSPDLATLGVLVGTGLLSVIGNTSMIMALKMGEASALAPVDFTRAVFAVLIGLAFLSEVPTLTAVIGTLVVIAGALLSLSRSPKRPDIIS
jgi:drug/metabolite transporter (DMT)-like permease